jgi:hypothetical protein
MGNKFKISSLTKSEIQHIRDEANFSPDQLAVFEALNKDTYYDYAIMVNLGLSRNRYYEVKHIVLGKIERIILADKDKSNTM